MVLSILALFVGWFYAPLLGGFLPFLVLLGGFLPYVLVVNVLLKGYVKPNFVESE